MQAHTVIDIHCSTDVQKNVSHSIKGSSLVAKDRSDLPHLCPTHTPLPSLCHLRLNTLLTMALLVLLSGLFCPLAPK